MKTIVNKLRFALLLGFIAASMTAWSQRANIEKMSISTQMFLDQIENKADYLPKPDQSKFAGPHHVLTKGREVIPPFCKPDTIDGRVYMSAFVRVSSDETIGQLESMDVIIQSQFGNGLMTVLIPIERIEDVAALAGVSRINAASPMCTLTNEVRKATNVDDLLTQSADAVSAGLRQKYDGSGVILGIIDTGIDFQHIAFKDKNGTTRIKRAYVYNGSSAQEYTNITNSSPTTDDNTEDHGTHTSSIAGGSSVIISGSNVTVTDDHANATYGGMAPGADLYLAGIKGLNNTYLANAVNNMCTYADAQGKPLVVSNSWGSQIGPHDGTGDVADVYNSLFGDNHPNRVALFAASNSAGNAPASEGGGYHISGTASSANPLGSILRCSYYSDTDNGYMYAGILANAWTRAGTTTLKCKIHVLNKNTGAILTSVEVTPTAAGATVSGLSTYYSGTLYAFKDYVSVNGKTQIMLYAPNGLQTRSANNYVSNYTLAVEFYPQTGSATIDVWGGNYCYFTDFVTTQGYNWKVGSDDMSVSDEAMISNVISIGAYVTKNRITNYSGTTYDYPDFTVGDIAYFSSYATANETLTGEQYPWITAPGSRVVSAVNHRHTASVDDYSYYGSNYNYDLVVNNTSNPYAVMDGTSMATPAAAGIVALWMQASLDNNAQHKNLTVNDVKNIMAETAIHDQWTNGTNAIHFGNGKIDALAGIQYILGLNSGTITVDPTELTFGGIDFYAGNTESKTVVVTNTTDQALYLTIAALNASLNGTPFSVTAITNNGNVDANGGTMTITITYAPTVVSANDQATLIIAEGVTVALTGSCVQAPDPYAASVNPVVGTLPYGTVTTGTTVTKTIIITNEGLNPFTPVVNVNSPFVASYDNSQLATGQSRTITVAFTPDQAIAYSEQLTITAPESNVISFTYTLTGTGEAPYIAATVSPTTLDFTNRVIGQIYTNNVTITNTGTQVFTPVINTDNLPAEYTVAGVAQVAISNSINLTVSYAPTAVGSHNGSFTVTIGNETYTVIVNGSAIEVTEATVAEGTTTNQYLPIYGRYYNNKQINQMIYPASMLTEIQGKKIKSMKFYSSNLRLSGGAFTVKMGTTTSTTFANTPTRITTNMTTVKTGQVAVSGGTELVITFDEPFEYNSGNLLIDFEVTTTGSSGNQQTYFYGVSQSNASFYSYGTRTSNGRYNNCSRLSFLPKVTFEWENEEPITAGTVSPDALTFTDVRIGRSDEGVVTVTNTGNQPFTPVIDTANLPAEFTVTGGGQLLPNGTLDLTVTYTPTDEGPHSGSFTVTIGDVTYTVTVTGNGYVPNNTLYSNEVMVPVYKTDLDVYGPYTYGQVIGDINHGLDGNVTNGLVKVQAKNIDAITGYRLFHNAGAQNNTTNMDNWASGNNQSSVAYAVHSVANDNFTTYAMDGNAWAQGEVFTFQNGEEAMWIDLHDNVEVGDNVDIWYVPVTVASSKLGNENTYGSRMEQNPKLTGDVMVSVGYDDSSEHREYIDPATGMEYVYVTAQANISALIPTIEINGHSYEAVMARAWRYYKPYIFGQGPSSDYVLELIGENTEISGATGTVSCSIGSDSWTETNSNDGYLFNEYTFCVKEGEQTDVIILARLYYKRNDVTNPASGMLRLSGSDGGYFAMDGEGDMPEEPTSINEYYSNKELVDITFVNPQGMTSSRPFEGVNIVVKRYSDGSTSTSKVLNR